MGKPRRDWSNTTFSGQEDVPDSCCLSDVVGCGVGILRLEITDELKHSSLPNYYI
jgi:hypothetical protein